jgi:hypothetical protein
MRQLAIQRSPKKNDRNSGESNFQGMGGMTMNSQMIKKIFKFVVFSIIGKRES